MGLIDFSFDPTFPTRFYHHVVRHAMPLFQPVILDPKKSDTSHKSSESEELADSEEIRRVETETEAEAIGTQLHTLPIAGLIFTGGGPDSFVFSSRLFGDNLSQDSSHSIRYA